MNKKHILYIGLTLTTIIGLQSCRTPEEVLDKEPVEEITMSMRMGFKSVADGYLTGSGEEKIIEGGMVINSQADWEILTAKMNSVNKTIKEQSIDFNETTVLAYFDQVRGSGGYTVEFASISKTGNSVQTVIRQTDSDGNDIEIMTQPYSIVMIDKSEGKVAFVMQ